MSDQKMTAAELRETMPGLNIDMLDADRLVKWAENLDTYGNDISHWANRAFVVTELRRLAEAVRAEVRDVLELRDQLADALDQLAALQAERENETARANRYVELADEQEQRAEQAETKLAAAEREIQRLRRHRDDSAIHARDREGERIGEMVFRGLDLDGTDSDGLETADPAEHIICAAKAKMGRIVEQAEARLAAVRATLDDWLAKQQEWDAGRLTAVPEWETQIRKARAQCDVQEG